MKKGNVWRLLLLVGLVAAVVSSAPRATGQATGAPDKEIDAIQRVIERSIDISNDPKKSSLPAAEKAALARQFHRPDSSFGSNPLPLYFGAGSAPVLHGAEAYIKSLTTNLEWYRRQNYGFHIDLEETQVYHDGRLAVVLATPRGVITAPDGKVLGASPGRWTVVLQKANDGNWYILHQHLSFYNPGSATPWPDSKLEGELAKVKPAKP